jgi:hypothetical protein
MAAELPRKKSEIDFGFALTRMQTSGYSGRGPKVWLDRPRRDAMSNGAAALAEQQAQGGIETILAKFDTHYVWNYGVSKQALRDLYEKAKREQWNGSTQLAWDTSVDPERGILPEELNPLHEYGPYRKLDGKQKIRLRHGQVALQLSQFLHGEQGALIVASQLVGGVPWMDAKYYAGTQTVDEARHVEVFARYLNDKLEWEWPINASLRELLDATISDSRWDFKYLGMQIIIEGLAMAAFGNLYQIAQEPLLKDLLKYVMKDESRHVAFGVLSLRGWYDDLPANERRDREDFVIYACELMRDRLIGSDIADLMGWNADDVRKHVLESPALQLFRRMLFARIVPNLKKLGMLTPRVREAFDRLGILQFEDYDAEAMDKQLGFL